ncbi:Uncharacterised protein [Klebsiella pneumoniae]|nr:Uncharacterised protein [Klebsiella pneumoniae]
MRQNVVESFLFDINPHFGIGTHFGFNIVDNIGHLLTEGIEFLTIEHIIFPAFVIFIHNRLETAGEVDPLQLVDLFKVADGFFQQFLQ